MSRIALWTYPTPFLPRRGGLHIQFEETCLALQRVGVEANIFNWIKESILDFELLHVFSPLNGNHRMVSWAHDSGIPVVLSTVLHPPFTRRQRLMVQALDKVVGRLTGWEQRLQFREVEIALKNSSKIIALGKVEKAMLIDGYGVRPDKLCTIPNGVPARFFESSPDFFRSRVNTQGPIALCVGQIGPYKNQLAVTSAVTKLDMDTVLIGPCWADAKAYLETCVKRGDGRTHYLGALDHDDPLLASAYAAADVFVLPSRTEVMPLVVLEALAAGTPVVITRHHSLDIEPRPGLVEEVDPMDEGEIQRAIEACLQRRPDPEECRALVRGYTWDAVARQLTAVYDEVLASRGSVEASSGRAAHHAAAQP